MLQQHPGAQAQRVSESKLYSCRVLDVQLSSRVSGAQSEAPGAAAVVGTDFNVLSVEETFLSVTCRLSSERLMRRIKACLD